jgi:thioredoxin-related protein
MIFHRTLLSIFILFIIGFNGTAGEKTALQWHAFDSGIAEAKKSNKKVIIDVYTNWCHWCKKMDKEVYENEKVTTYIGKNYITIKLNAESNSTANYKDKSLSERELAQAFGVTGYPTTIFMEPNGELITSVSGYYDADKFINIAKFIGENHYKKMKWEEFLKKVSPDTTK